MKSNSDYVNCNSNWINVVEGQARPAGAADLRHYLYCLIDFYFVVWISELLVRDNLVSRRGYVFKIDSGMYLL